MGPYFLSAVDPSGTVLNEKNVLIVNEQAYGLNGLVALYQRTRSPELLQTISEFYESFFKRFHDPVGGGFFDGFELSSGQPTQTKSYNSTVYVATAFLLELATTNAQMSQRYLPAIFELTDIVANHFIDKSTGWIVENFDRNWRPSWRDWQKQGEFTVGVVGHNFQAAWLLLRVSELSDPGSPRHAQYREAAKYILQSMLNRGAVDHELGGFFDSFKRETSTPMWNTNKAWWQQAEGILALALAERLGVLNTPEAKTAKDRAIDFYFNNFVDRVGGGEFAVLDRSGRPNSDTEQNGKGNLGKSTYHTVELARYMLLYSPSEFRRVVIQNRVERFFANYALIQSEGFQKFQEAQSTLLAPGIVTEVNNFGNSVLYQRREGYFESLGDWSKIFRTGNDFGVEILSTSGPNGSIAVRLKGTLVVTRNGVETMISPEHHNWTEYFEFDQHGLIKKLSVIMNIRN